MRSLDRSAVSAPRCLSRYHHGRNQWGELTHAERAEIRSALIQLQGARCAYCECLLENVDDVERSNAHIEHFVQRRQAPQLTFVWRNLFHSCSFDNRCGHYKDRAGVRPDFALLLKPDVDDPSAFLRFRDDGSVEARPGVSPLAASRAHETIRVFALNHAALRAQRAYWIGAAVQQAEEIVELGDDPDVASLYAQLVDALRGSAFEGAIVDVLTS